MPMFNDWVPEGIRPWIYLLFALLFQLSSGIYFANLQHMMGAMAYTATSRACCWWQSRRCTAVSA